MSMFGRPTKKSNWRNEMPPGAIKSMEEMRDLIIEARKEKKAIRIYTVNQGGRLGTFYIISKSRIYKKGSPFPDRMGLNRGINDIGDVIEPAIHDHSCINMRGTNRRWFKSHEFIDSYTGDYTEHRMFTNKQHALNYSNKLKNDPVYQQEVKDWHAYCDKMFNDYDRF